MKETGSSYQNDIFRIYSGTETKKTTLNWNLKLFRKKCPETYDIRENNLRDLSHASVWQRANQNTFIRRGNQSHLNLATSHSVQIFPPKVNLWLPEIHSQWHELRIIIWTDRTQVKEQNLILLTDLFIFAWFSSHETCISLVWPLQP